jgi:hypothetical protein
VQNRGGVRFVRFCHTVAMSANFSASASQRQGIAGLCWIRQKIDVFHHAGMLIFAARALARLPI